ncbi:MAG: DUF3798 domain-containing protein [Dethiobacteria bacterium]
MIEEVKNEKQSFVFSIIIAHGIAHGSVLAGCGNQSAQTGEVNQTGQVGQDGQETAAYKIGVVTPTLSTSEDEFRAADMMAKKYPDNVKHITLPENFSTEIETGLSQITSLADDPQMKAIIAHFRSGGSTARPAKGGRNQI